MELTKIRNLSDEELKHQEKTSSEQLFRIRFQVALGQNDGVKKLRQLARRLRRSRLWRASASWAFTARPGKTSSCAGRGEQGC